MFPEEDYLSDRTEQVRMVLRLFQTLNRQCQQAVALLDAGGDREPLRTLYVTCGNLELQVSRALAIMTVAQFGQVAEQVSQAVATRGWANVQPSLAAVRTAAANLRSTLGSTGGLAAIWTPSSITDNGRLVYQTPLTAAQNTQIRGLLAAVTDEFTAA